MRTPWQTCRLKYIKSILEKMFVITFNFEVRSNLHKVPLALKDAVKDPEDVGMAGQLNTVVEFSRELLSCHLVAVHGLEDDLLPGHSLLRQPDSAVPALTAMRGVSSVMADLN